MTPEQISQLIEIAQSVGLVSVGALGGVFSAWISANKNLKTVELQIKNVNKNATTEKDVLFYREALLNIDKYEAKLHEIVETTIAECFHENSESKILTDIDSRLDLLSKIESEDQKVYVEKTRKGLQEQKRQFSDDKLRYNQERKDAMKDLTLSLSEILTGVYLTGNENIIHETKTYLVLAHETYAVFRNNEASLDDMSSVNYSPLSDAKEKLKVTISKEFRKLILPSIE